MEAEFVSGVHQAASVNGDDHGWQKVTYVKRQRKGKPADLTSDGNKVDRSVTGDEKANVFVSLERQSEVRHKRIVESEKAADFFGVDISNEPKSKSGGYSGNEGDQAGVPDDTQKLELKKLKPKKAKKPKITPAEAASKIDPIDLVAFLADVSDMYEDQQEILMMRFADYFGKAFSTVSSAQFPWVRMLSESALAKTVDIPMCYISEAVYKSTVDWLNKRPLEALCSFVLWALDSILADFVSHQASSKNSKKGGQPASSKSQVAMFLVLAMVLRRKPDVLINVLPMLKDASKFQGHEKIPLFVWMIAQASQGELAVGLYCWTRFLLPLISSLSYSQQPRDIILQLAERILATPKAQQLLVNNASRKGERLVPPSALDVLLRATFPSSTDKAKDIERIEFLYPCLKEVALAGSARSKTMKQVSAQTLSFTLNAAGDSIPELSKESAGIFIWCLTQNPDCYNQWDNLYEENIAASTAILRRLSEDWNALCHKLTPLDNLRSTMYSFKQKNEKAMGSRHDGSHRELFREAHVYCKLIMKKSSRGHHCMKCMALVVLALAVGGAIISPITASWQWRDHLSVLIGSQFSL